MTLEEATNIVVNRQGDLVGAFNFFVLQKARLDKYFTEFLDDNEKEMGDDNYDSPAWKQYRVMLRDYDTVEKFITTSKYYITKHV
jgi:hypothetical protein